jgi:tripartite-type tricarboxylate transporter receptor subunit TctC
MKLPRRQFLHLAMGAATLPALSRFASAESYPTRPVRWIDGFPAGSAPDIVARLFGQWLSERLAQPFVIETRTGAGGNVATEAVVNARPDGYTLLAVTPANAINATLYDKLNFNFIQDITPVAAIMRSPYVMLVNPSVSVKTVPEFIAYAKANAGQLNMASSGSGTGTHLCGELFKMITGVNMVHVPYRNSPFSDLIGGHVQVYFGPAPASIEFIRTGRVRALAVTTAKRSEALPQIPTVDEFVRGYEASGWVGMGAPKNTSAEIVEKLNTEINACLADPKMKARLSDLGAEPMSMTPVEFAKFVVDETEKWARVVKFVGIKPQ